MENLTIEQRIEKIKEIAGDDIGVILNMNMKGIHVNEGFSLPFVISGNTIINDNDNGIIVNEHPSDLPTNTTKYDIEETDQGTRWKLKEDTEDEQT